MTGHFIISRLLEKASRSSVGHPYALGAGLDALGSRPHLFRAGLDALHLIRAVILLPGPGLDLLVLSDLFVPVVVGEAGLEQVVTVLLERGVVHVRSEPVVLKDGASGWHLHPLRLIDRPSARRGRRSGRSRRAVQWNRAARICRRHCRHRCRPYGYCPRLLRSCRRAGHPPSVSGEVPCSPEATVPAGFGGCGIIACSFALMVFFWGGGRGMPSSDAVAVGAIESDT